MKFVTILLVVSFAASAFAEEQKGSVEQTFKTAGQVTALVGVGAIVTGTALRAETMYNAPVMAQIDANIEMKPSDELRIIARDRKIDPANAMGVFGERVSTVKAVVVTSEGISRELKKISTELETLRASGLTEHYTKYRILELEGMKKSLIYHAKTTGLTKEVDMNLPAFKEGEFTSKAGIQGQEVAARAKNLIDDKPYILEFRKEIDKTKLASHLKVLNATRRMDIPKYKARVATSTSFTVGGILLTTVGGYVAYTANTKLQANTAALESVQSITDNEGAN